MPDFALSTDNWDLHRRANRDRERHNEKVKEVIKENLGEIVSRQDLITQSGDRIVKVPIRSLELPRIRFDDGSRERVGQGDGNTKPGDVLGRAAQKPAPGAGRQPGEQPGVDYYEAEITVDEIAELVFEDLHLPNLQQKGTAQIPADQAQFNSVSRRGLASNLDRKRTLMEAWRRNAREGTPGWKVQRGDERFRTWEVVTEPQRNAVVIAMRDVSGSMGEFEAYICRSFYYWMLRFLKRKYTTAEIVFVTCHTDAQEVDEQAFFGLGESGGTRMSSAYKLALHIMEQRYNPREWNVYPFLFSDGYNWGDAECVELVRKMALTCSQVGYGEIAGDAWSHSGQFAPLGQALQEAFADDPRVTLVRIATKADVWPALQKFFTKYPELQAA